MQLFATSMRRPAALAAGAPCRAVRVTSALPATRKPAGRCPQRRRMLPAAAAGSGSGSGDAPEQQPAEARIQAAADSVEGAVADAEDATAAAVNDAAAAASGAVSDAADAASALVSDAADAASALVSDATDAASALVEDAADAADAVVGAAQQAAAAAGDALSAAAANLPGQPAAIDWAAAPAPGAPDARFAGLKVLVAGATGGTGRRVVEALRAKGVATRALVRNSSRAAQLLPSPSDGTSNGPSFEVVMADVFQYASLPAAFAGGINALVIATAANDKTDPLGPFNVDYQGTLNLLAAAKKAGVQRVVLVSSIGADELLNPLNLFWGILFWKKRGEEAVQRSGLAATIVRPGGLLNTTPAGRSPGSIVMAGPGEFGFPPKRSGAILRSQVADVVVEALVCEAAVDKVVEVVAESSAPLRPLDELFAAVRM